VPQGNSQSMVVEIRGNKPTSYFMQTRRHCGKQQAGAIEGQQLQVADDKV
jgi:hypothetical protein